MLKVLRVLIKLCLKTIQLFFGFKPFVKSILSRLYLKATFILSMKNSGLILNLHASFIFAINYSNEYLVRSRLKMFRLREGGTGIKVVRAADKINLYSAFPHIHF